MTTAAEALAVAEGARDDAAAAGSEAATARREVAALEGRVGGLISTVDAHRLESQAAHVETQRMIGEVVQQVAHLKGVASVAVPPAPAPAVVPPVVPQTGILGVVASVPPPVWGAAGTFIGGIVVALALASALGVSVPEAKPAELVDVPVAAP